MPGQCEAAPPGSAPATRQEAAPTGLPVAAARVAGTGAGTAASAGVAILAAAAHRRSTRTHDAAFWVVAAAFLCNMGFSAVPTPLYVLYQRRDHFGDLMITVVFAMYAVGVMASLFLGGHLSDWYGRRRLFVAAVVANLVAAALFLADPSVAGLLVARTISGVSVGLTTATATSYLGELHATARPGTASRRAEVVATGANLGGIGFGPLVAGLLAQFAPAPLELPYLAFGAAMVVLTVVILLSPETVRRPEPRPRYRPQRVMVPLNARGTFFAASLAGLVSFAVYGLFTSLAPSFLAGTLHESSHAVAGATTFAAFAAGAVAQMLQGRSPVRSLLLRSVPTIVLGLALLAGAMWAGSLAAFLVGGVVTGAGAGMVFKGALGTVASIAPAGARAEVLAGFFLGAYVGLSVPVVGLGVAVRYLPAREVVVVFAAMAALAIAASVRRLTVATPAGRGGAPSHP